MHKTTSRVLEGADPFDAVCEPGPPWAMGRWPSRWVTCDGLNQAPAVAAFRLRFKLTKAGAARVHVTADERYALYLDGELIGRGSERGDEKNWFFESFDLRLSAGPHVLVARVWALGELRPFAQVTQCPGFLLAAESPHLQTLSTGIAPWQVKMLDGCSFAVPHLINTAWSVGARVTLDGRLYNTDHEKGEGTGWQPVKVGRAGAHPRYFYGDVDRNPLLRPGTLLPQMDEPRRVGRVRHVAEAAGWDVTAVPVRESDHRADEASAWQALLAGCPLRVAARSRRRVILNLGNYYCLYPSLTLRGGKDARVRLGWAESLFEELPTDKRHHGPDFTCGREKGNRNEIERKFFVGYADVFISGGGRRSRRFEPLWFGAGRYVELLVETSDEPLTVESLEWRETRYPLAIESRVSTGDAGLDQTIPLMIRGLEMCSHETYMDCPYYEQMMYVGDTRIEALLTYVLSPDTRLQEKAIALYDASRRPEGLTQSRYPVFKWQVIPPFSLWWVAMVHDHAMYRDKPEWTRRFLPGVRGVLDAFFARCRPDGLIGALDGWNFADWVPGWDAGIPPDGKTGVSGLINWHIAYALRLAAELEEALGEPELARLYRRRLAGLSAALQRSFWNERRGLFADDLSGRSFSEHTQCLALLSGALSNSRAKALIRRMRAADDLKQTTIYFSHYLFETCHAMRCPDTLFSRLDLWRDLIQLGLKTPVESPGATRSDCHAWGSHPLFHFYSSVLGIRPAAPGFRRVRIEPMLGPLEQVSGRMVHPRGIIEVALERKNGNIRADIRLPSGLYGDLVFNGKVWTLKPGGQTVIIEGRRTRDVRLHG